MRFSARNLILLITAYSVIIGSAVWGVFAARSWAIATLDNPAEQEKWREWQEDTKARQDAQGIPANRRGHSSDEPPVLILLRDHLTALLATAILLSTFLFAFFVFVLCGATRANTVIVTEDQALPKLPMSH
ncbi:MAG: hypothetical protein MPJ50_04920 [Pirellulales bacterium]|nr:hypothetical protein [Pirellulales bacterium]